MKRTRYALGVALVSILLTGCLTTRSGPEARAPIAIADFEDGIPEDWTADGNWRTDDNSVGGWYAGWQGKTFAWSGEGGEPTTGNLRSPVFVLEREAVEVSVAGWSDIRGRTANRWNYVTLNLEDGTEIDRAYTPNTTAFTPTYLNGAAHEGERVYLEAVDDGTEATFSMICVDDVRQNDLPPVRPVPEVRSRGGWTLENDHYLVEVDRRTGVIVRLRDKTAGIDFLHEPRLAGNFRFTLPLPGDAAWQATEANYIHGDQQRLDRVDRGDDSLTLHWDGPLRSVLDETYDVSATMRIAMVDDRIEFGFHVDNRTDLPVGELYYPVLGGMRGITANRPDVVTDARETELQLPVGAGIQSAAIFKSFANQSWLGIMGPEQHYGYPDQVSMPWMVLHQPALNRSLYFGAHDPVCRYKVLHLDLQPGIAGARPDGNWPRDGELNGLPLGVRMCLVHMPYQPARTAFDASPVVLRAYDGGWAEAAAYYGAWFAAHAALPEGEALPKMQECDARAGGALAKAVKEAQAAEAGALLIRNWRKHPDGAGLPWFVPAAELTGGLTETIAAAHAAGLRVYFAFDIDAARLACEEQPAGRAAAAFAELREPLPDPELRDVLSQFVCMDPWGVYPMQNGWSEGKLHSEHLATTQRRGGLNPGVPGYRELLAGQCGQLAALGADGIVVGRFFARALDFQAGAGATADQVSWQGGVDTLEAMLAAAREQREDFALITDTAFDSLLSLTPYVGKGYADDAPIAAAFPNAQPRE